MKGVHVIHLLAGEKEPEPDGGLVADLWMLSRPGLDRPPPGRRAWRRHPLRLVRDEVTAPRPRAPAQRGDA